LLAGVFCFGSAVGLAVASTEARFGIVAVGLFVLGVVFVSAGAAVCERSLSAKKQSGKPGEDKRGVVR
jgi:hypothetical protein